VRSGAFRWRVRVLVRRVARLSLPVLLSAGRAQPRRLRRGEDTVNTLVTEVSL
jgi:hypothetical protein